MNVIKIVGVILVDIFMEKYCDNKIFQLYRVYFFLINSYR